MRNNSYSTIKQKELNTLGQTNQPRTISRVYREIHNIMRNVDGLQPQEAFDELLKLLFVKQLSDVKGIKKIELADQISFSQDLKKIPLLLKEVLRDFLTEYDSWFLDLWKDRSFHLSDQALIQVWEVLSFLDFSDVPYDIRGLAMREFLDEKARKSLGIYLTPDDVVRMMINVVGPKEGDKIYDPACGSGTFLTEALKYKSTNYGKKNYEIWGTDKNPRMLLLSELNLGHVNGIIFNRRLMDSLFPTLTSTETWPEENSFDCIFTNPPFGVILDNVSFDLRSFRTCIGKNNFVLNKQQSEIMFIEKSLSYIRPGGTLSIVTPSSILTNSSLDYVREVLGKMGYIYALVQLPPETFAVAGTQTNTTILFVKKYKDSLETSEEIQVAYARVSNVGYDSTGRIREGNQLNDLHKQLELLQLGNLNAKTWRSLEKTKKIDTFNRVSELIKGADSEEDSVRLETLVEKITTGKTPPRIGYSDEGLFLIKVGNLTGRGIDWSPRDRNFVKVTVENQKRFKLLRVKNGDILLTSSAHSPVYIAKKTDIIYEVPEEYGREAATVGEVMLIRPKADKINPYRLLVYLRLPSTLNEIQSMIRGQTAHLYANDMLNLSIPARFLEGSPEIDQMTELLKEEARIAYLLSKNTLKQSRIVNKIDL